MSGSELTTPEKLQVDKLLDEDSTSYVDSYSPIHDNGSWGCRCPQPLARMLGIPDAVEIETWVNLDGGYVVHRVVTDEEDGDG